MDGVPLTGLHAIATKQETFAYQLPWYMHMHIVSTALPRRCAAGSLRIVVPSITALL
jgi:hypothetical protein